jgi:hypothetical protein
MKGVWRKESWRRVMKGGFNKEVMSNSAILFVFRKIYVVDGGG